MFLLLPRHMANKYRTLGRPANKGKDLFMDGSSVEEDDDDNYRKWFSLDVTNRD